MAGVRLELGYYNIGYCISSRDLVREGGVGLVGLGNTSFILVISYNNQCYIVLFYVQGHSGLRHSSYGLNVIISYIIS